MSFINLKFSKFIPYEIISRQWYNAVWKDELTGYFFFKCKTCNLILKKNFFELINKIDNYCIFCELNLAQESNFEKYYQLEEWINSEQEAI